MGQFHVSVAIGDPAGDNWVELEALVDTGASITSAPASVLRQLGVSPQTRRRFRFGQGETRSMDVGRTWLRVQDEEIWTQVLFNEEGTTPLLGALALEDAYLGVDPVAQILVPVDGMMMRADD